MDLAIKLAVVMDDGEAELVIQTLTSAADEAKYNPFVAAQIRIVARRFVEEKEKFQCFNRGILEQKYGIKKEKSAQNSTTFPS